MPRHLVQKIKLGAEQKCSEALTTPVGNLLLLINVTDA
jgi:hypothetical protein